MIHAILVGSALTIAQAWAPIGLPETTLPDPVQSRDVAYDAISEGRADEAIARIEKLLAQQPDDAALLINLGAAHLAQGDHLRAAECYRRAAAASERYSLELADGTWMDSRRAARLALQSLEGSTMLARAD
jgi:cytochrome c-type biogenesis protein CcmH/NrfG